MMPSQSIDADPSEQNPKATPAGNTIFPNLFIIGAMKSGTTLLHKILSSHPAILMSNPKEPSYFVEPGQLHRLQPHLWRLGYWRSEARYLQLFQTDKQIKYAGEASVFYTHTPLATGVAERIRRFNPHAELVYIMRDPVERTISHYWERVVNNSEHRSIVRAILDDDRYCDVSHYAMQLAPYLNRFNATQIHILTLEELLANPEKITREIFRWLAIDDTIPIVATQNENQTPFLVEQRMPFWGILRSYLMRYDYALWAIDFVPESARRYGARIFSRKVNRLDADIERAVQYLRPLQRRQTEELSLLLGRDFPEWKTLNS